MPISRPPVDTTPTESVTTRTWGIRQMQSFASEFIELFGGAAMITFRGAGDNRITVVTSDNTAGFLQTSQETNNGTPANSNRTITGHTTYSTFAMNQLHTYGTDGTLQQTPTTAFVWENNMNYVFTLDILAYGRVVIQMQTVENHRHFLITESIH